MPYPFGELSLFVAELYTLIREHGERLYSILCQPARCYKHFFIRLNEYLSYL